MGQVSLSAPLGRHKFSPHSCIYWQIKLHKSYPFGCTLIPYSYHINTHSFFYAKVWWHFVYKSIHITLTFSSTRTYLFISYWMAPQYQATFNSTLLHRSQKLLVCIPIAVCYYSIWANKYVICPSNFSLLRCNKRIQIRLFIHLNWLIM